MALEIDLGDYRLGGFRGDQPVRCQALDFKTPAWAADQGAGTCSLRRTDSQLRLGSMPCRDEMIGKNRLHLDLRPDDQEVEVRRLVDLVPVESTSGKVVSLGS